MFQSAAKAHHGLDITPMVKGENNQDLQTCKRSIHEELKKRTVPALNIPSPDIS